MRSGIGYDIHRLVAGRKLILGGVEIDYHRGLEGHSDADVLIHAIGDALLGAAGLGDIGRHYPDTDERYRGVSSLKLLEDIRDKVRASEFKIENIDATVICREPKLAPLIPRMEVKLSGTLTLLPGRVNIKATTNEGLDAVGRGDAIAALAITTLTRMSNDVS